VKRPVMIAVGLVALGLSGACPEDEDPSMGDPTLVKIEAGALRGIVTADVRWFRGIPYAAPPVGTLRWRPPQVASPWTGERDATQPGHLCPQLPEAFADLGSIEEDCLTLSVTTPLDADPRDPRPVMVWLHGGGGTNGGGSLFDPRRLVVDGDVVVVSINYRLGIFGAFGLPGLEGAGTFGLQDQRAALAWVRDNISEFGGNPDNVTVFGESYGGYGVAAHLVSPGSEGLLHRAVLQSSIAMLDYPAETLMPGVPALPSMWISADELGGIGAYVAEQLGCTDPATMLDCLRGASVEALLPYTSLFTRYAFGNPALPEDPVAAIRAGRVQPVPVISGGTRDEARLFVALFYDSAGQPVTEESYAALLQATFGDDAARVQAEYPQASYDSPSLAWAAVVTDRVWALRTMEQSRSLAAVVSTHAFEFADRDAPPNVPFPPGFPPGAFHNAEVGYQLMVDGEELPLGPEQWVLAESMNRYWASFAHDGDPNVEGLPSWDPFDGDAAVPFVLSLAPGEGGIAPVDYGTEHHLAFWEALTGGS